MLVATLSTAGVSEEVAQELQVGPQMLEDFEEPMPARPATLKDPGTPDQLVMEQHSLTHFPSQPWCKMCVESRGHDSPHREQSKIDAVAPQLQFDYGYMGDGSPLQIACFLVGADTSSGAILATMVPDSEKMDMPYVVEATAKWVRDLGYERFCLHGEKGVLQLLLQKNVVLRDKTGKFYDMCHRHRAIRAMEQLRKPSPQCVDSLEHIWQFSKTKIPSFEVTTHSPMLPWTIRHAAWILTRYNVRRDTRMTSVREGSWTEVQKRDPATG